MTPTPLTFLILILLGGLSSTTFAGTNHRPSATPTKDQPAASVPPTDTPPASDTPDTPDTSRPFRNERALERMRQKRQAMRHFQKNAGNRPRGLFGPADHERGPMQGSRDGARPHRRSLTKTQQAEALAVLREMNPDFADKIERVMKTNPARARRAIHRFGPRLLKLAKLKKTNPDLYQLKITDQRYNFQTFKLIRRFHEARAGNNAAQTRKLTRQLRDLLDKHFDVRMKLRERELTLLEKRIEALRKELKDHHQRKQQLIDEQIQRLTAPGSFSRKPSRPRK